VALYRDLSIFTGTAHPDLARSVCQYLGVDLGKAEVFEFSNENIFVKINQNVREQDVFVIQPTYPNVSRSVMELLIMLDALKRASASRVTAVIPYFAYGRSDKKDQPRVPITARLIADMIQVAGADRVLTVDLHAGQVQGFFKIPVDELTAVYLLSDYFRQLDLLDPGLRESSILELVTTDTVRLSDEKRSLPGLRLLTVSMLIGEAISRIHTGSSVGALFGAPV
jgi:ribose-phosphate pyrophosphokinase